MSWHASSWSNRLLETLRLSFRNSVNPNDPKLKDNDKPSYKTTCVWVFFNHLLWFICQETILERSFPREKLEAITDRGDRVGLRAKLLRNLELPLYFVPGSFKPELNKLNPALQPVNLTGRLLLQLGKSLQCDTAHLWWAAGNSAHTGFPELQPLITQLPGSARVAFSVERQIHLCLTFKEVLHPGGIQPFKW